MKHIAAVHVLDSRRMMQRAMTCEEEVGIRLDVTPHFAAFALKKDPQALLTTLEAYGTDSEDMMMRINEASPNAASPE